MSARRHPFRASETASFRACAIAPTIVTSVIKRVCHGYRADIISQWRRCNYTSPFSPLLLLPLTEIDPFIMQRVAMRYSNGGCEDK